MRSVLCEPDVLPALLLLAMTAAAGWGESFAHHHSLMQAPLLRWIKIPVLLQAGLEARAAAARRAAMMEGGGTALTRLAVAMVREGV